MEGRASEGGTRGRGVGTGGGARSAREARGGGGEGGEGAEGALGGGEHLGALLAEGLEVSPEEEGIGGGHERGGGGGAEVRAPGVALAGEEAAGDHAILVIVGEGVEVVVDDVEDAQEEGEEEEAWVTAPYDPWAPTAAYMGSAMFVEAMWLSTFW